MKYALNEWGLRREFQERAEAGTTDSFPRGGRVCCLCPLESLSCLEKEKSKNSENPLISRLRKSNSNHYTNKKAQPRNILCTSLLVELPCTASMNKGFPERTTSLCQNLAFSGISLRNWYVRSGRRPYLFLNWLLENLYVQTVSIKLIKAQDDRLIWIVLRLPRIFHSAFGPVLWHRYVGLLRPKSPRQWRCSTPGDYSSYFQSPGDFFIHMDQ